MKRIKIINKKISLILLTSIIIVFTSCTSQKKLIYLQEKANSISGSNSLLNKSPEYHLRANDILFIKINSLDPDNSAFFNGGASGSGNMYQFQNEIGIYLNSYTISDSGSINIPISGNIYVKDLTVADAQKEVQKAMGKYLKDATVVVKLANYRVSIIGDIERPGVYTFYQDNVNILEAIAKAGDLTPYGNRYRVMLIRKTEAGDKVSMIDLTDRNLLNKPEFFILPNDIIYVEPNKAAKSVGFATFPWSVVLSSVSTIVTIYALLKK
ncbi:MAG: polysaccharide biosynthesis/export family protein [Bacteroidetes bacterium]|nr:polysaccharide biosynthesis/export family protein [Bacteroidota bacterium]